MPIGAPVTALDDDSGDVLNYKLEVAGAGNDNGEFAIDPATGQLMTSAELNYEMPMDADVANDDDNEENDNIYAVTVRAFDSSGAATGIITVNITVSDVNEPPTFDADTIALTRLGKAIDLQENMTVVDFDVATPEAQATFTGEDPEEGAVTLFLSGSDMDKFELVDVQTDPGSHTKVLRFKGAEAPDFENPGDHDGDNIYEVTVVASDGNRTAMRSVTVKVTDDPAEEGKITLSSQAALIGTAITATLTDSDGGAHPASPKVYPDDGISRVTWSWYSLINADQDIDDENPDTGDVILIEGANSRSYTPTSDEDGRVLRARANYFDRTYNDITIGDDDDQLDNPSFMDVATSGPTTAVRDDPANSTPMFTGTVERFVEENAPGPVPSETPGEAAAPGRAVGLPVTAVDADNHLRTYALSGPDENAFAIDAATAQITVKNSKLLDFEDQEDDDGRGDRYRLLR